LIKFALVFTFAENLRSLHNILFEFNVTFLDFISNNFILRRWRWSVWDYRGCVARSPTRWWFSLQWRWILIFRSKRLKF